MKIAFDTSIHLGQFDLRNESYRIAAKNSQIAISSAPELGTVGIIAFNEVAHTDNIIWMLEREPQDIFYKFMDVYYSVKNIQRVPLASTDAERALAIHSRLGMGIENALSVAVALTHGADELHSLYGELQSAGMRRRIESEFGLKVCTPTAAREQSFAEPGLERFYQDALAALRAGNLNLPDQFHP